MRTHLTDTQIDSKALSAMQNFHPEIVQEIQKAIEKNKVVVVGMGGNVFVKKARKLLEENKMGYEYIEHGNYLSKWKERLAIKLWSGWPTFPQIFIDGKLIGGYRELESLKLGSRQ